MPSAQPIPLRVAIIGGGPGGLGAAIALSKLDNIEVTVYEQATELREIGAGINISLNCWKVLELLGAAGGVRGHLSPSTPHRNGLTGEILKETHPNKKTEPKYLAQRVRRTNLQASLIAQVPAGIIKLNKKLESLENTEKEVLLTFKDGTSTSADLIVGGDGIRSVVRQAIFPNHSIAFTGTTIWRVLIPLSSVSSIPDLQHNTSWWHGPSGHFYGSPVDDPSITPASDQMFEIAARSVIDPSTATGKRFSWGVPATNERVEAHFTEYDPRLRAALAKVPPGSWKEFSAFAGPRLSTLTGWSGRVVLIGDASHPLSGAFGSGAAFALEDGWILARSVEYVRANGKALGEALEIFDEIRSPYYKRMYEYLDQQKKKIQIAKIANPGQTFQESLQARIPSFGGEGELSWIYGNNIKAVWEEFIRNR